MAPAPRRLSPELALLAACALWEDSALAGVVAPLLARPDFTWERFDELARYHAVEQIAGARLRDLAPKALPDWFEQSLQLRLLRDTALHTAQVRTSAGIMQALQQAGVAALVLKGAGLAHLLYAPTPEFRSSGDIDILVAPETMAKADSVLRAFGLTRTWPDPGTDYSAHPTLLLLANVFDYSGALNERIELHCRPTGNEHALPVTFAEFLGTSTLAHTPHGPLQTLDGPLNVLYLAHHALTSYEFRLKWFCDMAHARRRGGMASCAQLVQSYARPLPLRTVAAVDGLLEWLDYAISAAADASSKAVPISRQVDRMVASMEQARHVSMTRTIARLPFEMANLWFVMKLLPRGRARRRELLLALSDPRDALTLPLPPRFAWVYAWIGPALSLFRYSGRWRRPDASL